MGEQVGQTPEEALETLGFQTRHLSKERPLSEAAKRGAARKGPKQDKQASDEKK